MRRLLAETDSRELAEWVAFSELEPIDGPAKMVAELCSIVAAIGGQKITPNQYLGIPEPIETDEQAERQADHNQSIFEGVAEAWFIQQGREAEFREWEAKRQANRDGNDGRISER